MENPKQGESELKTFNTTKKFAEELLFPMMKQYKDFQAQADFGDKDIQVANQMSEEVREISRYNGIKGMCETVYNLYLSIYSNVLLKNNKEEMKEMEEAKIYLKKLKEVFYEDRAKFFIQEYRNNHVVDVLNRKYSEEIKDIINIYNINCEILMTKNNLLHSDSKDEFMSDAEIMKEIKDEYSEE